MPATLGATSHFHAQRCGLLFFRLQGGDNRRGESLGFIGKGGFMSERVWHYTVAGQRHGPVGESELRGLVSGGQVPGDCLVWTDGMQQWVPVSQSGLVAQAVPTAAVAGGGGADGGAVAYFNPAGGLPPRAAATLRGYARPTGDTGDWPLDDQHLAQFESAFKSRKRVSAAAQLYRALLLLSAVGSVIFVLVGLASVSFSRGGMVTWAVGGGVSIVLA